MYITSAAALIIIVLTALFWKELKLISFDVEYAKTLQIPVTFTLILYRSLLIMTIIIGIQSVGAILISSLLIAPAVGARQWTNKLGTMCILAGCFGMVSAIWRYHLEYNSTKTAYRSCDYRHSVGYRTIESHICT